MKGQIKEEFEKLEQIDLTAAGDIIFVARQRRLYRRLEALPHPIKLALLQSLLFFIMFTLSPWPPAYNPLVYIPLMWITTYCLMLAIYWFVPHYRPRHKSHWIK